MPDAKETTGRRITLGSDAAAFLREVQAALHEPALEAVTIDMQQVSYLAPDALRILAEVGEAGRTSGKLIRLAQVRPAVYKALQLANLATRFERVQTSTINARVRRGKQAKTAIGG